MAAKGADSRPSDGREAAEQRTDGQSAETRHRESRTATAPRESRIAAKLTWPRLKAERHHPSRDMAETLLREMAEQRPNRSNRRPANREAAEMWPRHGPDREPDSDRIDMPEWLP